MGHVPGLELARQHYFTRVAPHLAGVPHTAARIGPGSEVLGFDTVRSTDHDWGPRLLVVVSRAELSAWLTGHLGFDPLAGVSVENWLTTPTQTLAEVTAGTVFRDDLGLGEARARLAWYPDDVWRYLLACQWVRIAEEEAFVGRTAEVGDVLGSAVVAARLVRDLMRLCLLMHRRYPPYSKWLGSAFAGLPCAGVLTPLLHKGLSGDLSAAYEAVAGMHNSLGLTDPVDPTTRMYYKRPYPVLFAGRFAEALMATVRDPAVRTLPMVGAVDQWVDSTPVLSDPAQRERLLTGRAANSS